MTIEQAIDRADRLRPNQYSTTEKVRWLSELDRQVYSEVLLMAAENWKPVEYTEEILDQDNNVVDIKTTIDYNNEEPVFVFEGYDEETPLSEELLVDDLYANLYVDYLISKFDYYNREAAAYNNSALVFNNQYTNYAVWYRRNHTPRRRKVRGI